MPGKKALMASAGLRYDDGCIHATSRKTLKTRRLQKQTSSMHAIPSRKSNGVVLERRVVPHSLRPAASAVELFQLGQRTGPGAPSLLRGDRALAGTTPTARPGPERGLAVDRLPPPARIRHRFRQLRELTQGGCRVRKPSLGIGVRTLHEKPS